MPVGKENKNASHEQATPIGQIASSGDLLEAHKKLMRDIWATWGPHRDGFGDQVSFTRLSVITLSQVAAVCAVDVHMPEDKFLAVCKANYEQAHKVAPKWS
jgi:hypothetical protein